MHSIENYEEWVDKYDSIYIHAPIKSYNESGIWWDDNEPYTAPEGIPGEKGWYNPDIVKENLPNKYDLILVDGPNGLFGRGGFYKHLDLFNTNVPIVIDDVNREAERVILEKVSEKINKDYKILDDNVTGVIL